MCLFTSHNKRICGSFAVLTSPKCHCQAFIDEILPIDDRKRCHFAYPQDVIRNHFNMKEVISHHEHCIYLGESKEKQ